MEHIITLSIKSKINFKCFISFLFLLNIFSIRTLNSINTKNLISMDSEIHLVIKGDGVQNLVYNSYLFSPSEVDVKGGKSCEYNFPCLSRVPPTVHPW